MGPWSVGGRPHHATLVRASFRASSAFKSLVTLVALDLRATKRRAITKPAGALTQSVTAGSIPQARADDASVAEESRLM